MGNVAEEGIEVINGERLERYGHPSINFTRIAGGWSAYLGIPVTPHNVCALMVILKQMRGKEGYHRDSVVDTVGYAALQEVLAGENTVGE